MNCVNIKLKIDKMGINVQCIYVHPVCSCLSGTLVDGVQSCLQLIGSIEQTTCASRVNGKSNRDNASDIQAV